MLCTLLGPMGECKKTLNLAVSHTLPMGCVANCCETSFAVEVLLTLFAELFFVYFANTGFIYNIDILNFHQ